MAEHNRIIGAGNMPPNLHHKHKELKRLHRAFDPTCGFYLARAVVGNTAGLTPGTLHHVAGINFPAEMLELVDPQTQAPPVYVAGFDDVEIVARNDNPVQPR